MSLLVLAMGLFSLGLYGVLTRRDLVAILASIEIMLASALLLLVGLAAGTSMPGSEGVVEATGVLLIVLAAAAAAVGLALVISVSRHFRTTRVDELTEVKG